MGHGEKGLTFTQLSKIQKYPPLLCIWSPEQLAMYNCLTQLQTLPIAYLALSVCLCVVLYRVEEEKCPAQRVDSLWKSKLCDQHHRFLSLHVTSNLNEEVRRIPF